MYSWLVNVDVIPPTHHPSSFAHTNTNPHTLQYMYEHRPILHPPIQPPCTHYIHTPTGVPLKPKRALQLVEAGAGSKADLIAKIVDLVEHHVLDLAHPKTAMRVS